MQTYNRNALIVEDNPVNQELLQEYMSMLGFNCALADDGYLGIDKFFAGQFDVVLLDLHMPRFSGFDFLNMIATANAKNRNQLIIVVTGDVEAIESDQFNDWPNLTAIAKPVDLGDLTVILEEYFALSA